MGRPGKATFEKASAKRQASLEKFALSHPKTSAALRLQRSLSLSEVGHCDSDADSDADSEGTTHKEGGKGGGKGGEKGPWSAGSKRGGKRGQQRIMTEDGTQRIIMRKSLSIRGTKSQPDVASVEPRPLLRKIMIVLGPPGAWRVWRTRTHYVVRTWVGLELIPIAILLSMSITTSSARACL